MSLTFMDLAAVSWLCIVLKQLVHVELSWDGSRGVNLNIQYPGGKEREVQVEAAAQWVSGKAGLLLALICCVVTDLKQCKQMSCLCAPPPPPLSAAGQLCIWGMFRLVLCTLAAVQKQCAAFPPALSGSARQHKAKSAPQLSQDFSGSSF